MQGGRRAGLPRLGPTHLEARRTGLNVVKALVSLTVHRCWEAADWRQVERKVAVLEAGQASSKSGWDGSVDDFGLGLSSLQHVVEQSLGTRGRLVVGRGMSMSVCGVAGRESVVDADLARPGGEDGLTSPGGGRMVLSVVEAFAAAS